MYKIVPPGGWDFDDNQVCLIKKASRGLFGKDRKDLIKRAGHRIADAMDSIELLPGEVPIHLLAIGSYEKYGGNRNGDGFNEIDCDGYHDTFCKFARFYRDHISNDPARSYGVVKHSTYHRPMSRVELIVGLNSTKEAARRNGGLLADEEMDIINRGDDFGVSMGCMLAADKCSACGNRARTPKSYCDGLEYGGSCPGGGLRRKMGKVVTLRGDVHHLCALNPEPRFGDISRVRKQADHIAFITGVLQKAAAGECIGGARLAEEVGLTMPWEIAKQYLTPLQLKRAEILHLCARWEQQFAEQPELLQLYAAPVQPIRDVPRHAKVASVVAACTHNQVILPLETFVGLYAEEATPADLKVMTQHAARMLRGKFAEWRGQQTWDLAVQDPESWSHAKPDLRTQQWAKGLADWQYKAATIQRRCLRNLGGELGKVSFAVPGWTAGVAAAGVAAEYARYQLATLATWDDLDSDRAVPFLIAQNWAS